VIVVDGHNLIGRGLRIPLSREEEGRGRVIERLSAWASSRRERVTVVFDGDRAGDAQAGRVGALRVIYAPSARTADDEILRLLRRSNPRSALVVTSDRRLAVRVRGLGGRVETAEAFWERVRPRRPGAPDPEKPEPAAEEVEEWLRVFREGKNPRGK